MNDVDALLIDRRPDGVGTITLNRPNLRNALDADQWERLTEAIVRLDADQSLRCLMITGAGDTFAAGGDLKSMLAELDSERGPAKFRDRIHHCLDALYRFHTPTIARVNGAAIGGGLELAIACDIRIVSESARFAMPAARFGMVMAYADFARLAGILGVDRARFLAITGEIIDGAEAFRIGLAHQLVSPTELDTVVEKLMRRMTAMEPEAVAWFRSAASTLEAGGDAAPLKAFEEACLTRDEFRRRVDAFMRK
jgi:enoyl-CoA hydratase/carnithine racemase